MKITYLYHSGFCIEGKSFKMIIDFYSKGGYELSQKYTNDGRQLYILASHGHGDHFDPAVFGPDTGGMKTKYIFSKDISALLKETKGKEIFFIEKGEIFSDANVWIKAFGSTDVGISFLIKAEEKTFFHAGDLNNWHWKEESTEEEAAEAERQYLAELNEIAAQVSAPDFAMFPVDPRLGTDYKRGAEQFADKIKPRLFLPMHFAAEYQKANAFKSYAEQKNCRFAEINAIGDEVNC